MIPKWIKKAYNDKTTKFLALFILIIGPTWSGLTYIFDNQSSSWWQAWAYFWGFGIVLIPIFYLLRNSK